MIDPSKLERYLKLRKRATDQSSAEQERKTAKHACARMRQKYVGIHAASIQLERELNTPEPPWDIDQPNQRDWKDNLRDWLKDTVSQVVTGLSQADKIEQDITTDFNVTDSFITIQVEIPVESALEASQHFSGSLEEYARLIGLRVGRDLTDYFEELGH